ncbi:hypothetical protein KXD40_005477 [Peronospora effusa]|nr:hypothetical protein KXD40_005477 [Peronospora effusa]
MGISRDSRHKRRETGGKRKVHRKKRKFELGRQPAATKLGGKRVHTVRVRGGHLKFRALHLEAGNFSWGTEVCARKTRILDVVYNASNNELVRTKTLVKGAVVLVDATPFRQWYEAHYGVKIGVKKNSEKVEEEDVKKSGHVLRKLANRQRTRVLDPKIDDQVASGRLLAVISSRPGQSGRADGYILEGKELEFYQRKLATKKSKKSSIARRMDADEKEEEEEDKATAQEDREQASHLRNLESNAYRFEEHETQDDEKVTKKPSQSGRMQFFASEQQYREKTGCTSGDYFQSRVMRQWEEKNDAVDENKAVEMLDLNWIAAQLEFVPPDIRYRMDPKYCTDLPLKPQDEDDRESDQHVAMNAATPATVPSKLVQGDEELDFLLNLSVSTSSEVKVAAAPSAPLSTSPAPTNTAGENEQLEEWLDDVLDM